eukprot:GFKZ01012887.1.p1 GENE.GFKZ01012887.1~~GFKZ01012887.1.p1  ORF type:complete len:131 (-),score=2.59 GFKZ01012887.1:134-526(-)
MQLALPRKIVDEKRERKNHASVTVSNYCASPPSATHLPVRVSRNSFEASSRCLDTLRPLASSEAPLTVEKPWLASGMKRCPILVNCRSNILEHSLLFKPTEQHDMANLNFPHLSNQRMCTSRRPIFLFPP